MVPVESARDSRRVHHPTDLFGKGLRLTPRPLVPHVAGLAPQPFDLS
jgi:hypothetical protein